MTDYVNVGDLNDNMDSIDSNIKTLANKPANSFTQTEVEALKNGYLATGYPARRRWGKTKVEVGLSGATTHAKVIDLLTDSDSLSGFEVYIYGQDTINRHVGIRTVGFITHFQPARHHITTGPMHWVTGTAAARNNSYGTWVTKGISHESQGNAASDDYKIVGYADLGDGGQIGRGIVVKENNKNSWMTPFSKLSDDAGKVVFTGGYFQDNKLYLIFKTIASTVIFSDIIYSVW